MNVGVYRLISDSACSHRNSYHGQHHAITREPDTVIILDRTFLMKIFSPFLFSAPDRYLRLLSKTKALDFLAEKKDWGHFIAELEKPWNDFILYVSVSILPQIFK